MTLHLVKLCVGIDALPDLRSWQQRRLQELVQAGQVAELCHKTRQTPRRRDELLKDGSLYWVIKGVICARQRIIDLKEMVREDGQPACGIVLDPEIVETVPKPRRPFQGWRYLKAAQAPADRGPYNDDDAGIPPGMREELRSLGLIS